MKKIDKIYKLIADNRDRFVKVASRYTKDKNVIDNAVQEQMLYFMQMNKDTLTDIYERDGLEGIVKYGAVAIHRALTSTRSNYYYKYRKYYTKIDTFTSAITYDILESGEVIPSKHLYNLPNEIVDYKWTNLDKIDKALDDMYWYDKKVFELYYYKGHTLDTLAEKTGISRNSLFTTIKKVRTMLKEILKDEIPSKE